MIEAADLSLQRLGGLMGRGEISALELARHCAERIERLDPALNSFVRVNPALEQEAERADVRRANGEQGPLLGIPVAVKDNLLTRGLVTTCASRILGEFRPLEDATAVRRLREAGAVILGKTNMDEFGMGSSTENSAFGPARNPWDTDRVPGGSSGGSAVAVAARMAPVALGSDTGGSVRQPAALCGVVGLKPTYGRVSRSGLVAFGSSLDQVGPLAATVADAACVLAAIAGADERDATAAGAPVSDYAEACRQDVAGCRIGLPRECFDEGLDDEVARAVRLAASRLEALGASIETVTLPHLRYTIPAYYLIATAEASSNLARFDGVRYGSRGEAADLSEMYRTSRGKGFGPEVRRRIMLGTFALSAGYHDRFYGKAQRVRTLVRRDFTELFASGIDALLTPTTPATAFRLGERVADPLAMYLSDVYTTTANLAGVPAMSVPAGTDLEGMPIGVQLIAPDFREDTLFRIGAAVEREFPSPAPPAVSA